MFPWKSKSFSRLYVKRPPIGGKIKRNKELCPERTFQTKRSWGGRTLLQKMAKTNGKNLLSHTG